MGRWETPPKGIPGRLANLVATIFQNFSFNLLLHRGTLVDMVNNGYEYLIRKVPLYRAGVVLFPLTPYGYTMIDPLDFGMVAHWSWRLKVKKGGRYAVHRVKREGSRPGRVISLHRHLLGLVDPLVQVDHINGDGLDNRRCNIRVVTNQQNSWNMRPKNPASGFKGVDYHRGRWRSRIRLAVGRIELGHYRTAEDAARAYDEAALKHFGEFALTNEMLGAYNVVRCAHVER